MPRVKRFKVVESTAEKSNGATSATHTSIPPARSDARSLPPSKGDVHQPNALAMSGTCSHSLPQTKNKSSSIPSHHSLDSDAGDIESFDEHVDALFAKSDNTSCKSRKKDYWVVKVVDDDETIKEAHLKVQDVWTLQDGRKIIVPCNEFGQAIGDAGGLLGGFIGMLGTDYIKFPICYASWRKVPKTYKDSVYDEIIKVRDFFTNLLGTDKRGEILRQC